MLRRDASVSKVCCDPAIQTRVDHHRVAHRQT